MILAEKVFDWAHEVLRASGKGRVILGLNGPQGVGKSTLGKKLEEMGNSKGVPVFSFSIDDFYLTKKDQKNLARKYEKSEYLQKRGYPGTHDIELGIQTLKRLAENDGDLLVPQYNKSADSGRGDRRSKEKWRLCEQDKKIIIFDGWMLGFLSTQNPEKSLEVVNTFLKDYEHWWKYLDGFIHLQIENFDWVIDWRIEAEENMKKDGNAGMTTSEVTGYATQFLPAYREYTETLETFAKDFTHTLSIQVDKNRNPTKETNHV